MSDSKSKFQYGVKAFREGNNHLAIDLFTEAIELGAEGHAPLDSRAAAYERLGRYKEALVDSRQVIRSFPDLPHGYSRASRLLTNLGQHDRAVALAKSALVRSKAKDSRAQNLLDNALVAQHNYLQELKKRQCEVGKMPFELVAIIFEILVHEHGMSPIRLGQIDHSWREIAYGLPGLWCKLVLGGRTNKHEAKTKFWMARSQGRIRELYLDDSKHLESCLGHMGNKTVEGLERIRFNFITQAADILTHYRFKADPIAFSWTCRTTYETATRRLPFETRPNGFRIAELELHNIILYWSIEVIQLSNLTKLVVLDSNLTVPDLYALLEKSRNIKVLEVQTLTSTTIVTAPEERLILPYLTTLKLTLDPTILQYIQVPNVKILQFKDLRLRTALHHLNPANPVLTSLSIFRCSTNSNDQIPLPETLTELEIMWSAADVNAMVERFIAGQCPNITHFNLTGTNVHVSSVCRLVKIRNPVDDPTATPAASDQSKADTESVRSNSIDDNHNKSDKAQEGRPKETEEGKPNVQGTEENKANVQGTEESKPSVQEAESKPTPARLKHLVLDRCEFVNAEVLPWLRQRVPVVRCTFESQMSIRIRKRLIP